MKTSRERPEIETVLRALSEVDAPTHLGQEVARELVRSLQTRSARQPRRAWSFLLHPAMLGATCTAFVAFVLITSFFRAPFSRTGPLPEQAYSHPQLPPTAPKPVQQMLYSVKVSTEVHVGKISQVHRNRSAPAPPPIDNPAPVAPLSEQEKLLVRIAQRRDPVQLTSLNGELQEALDTTRTSDFIKLSNGGTQ